MKKLLTLVLALTMVFALAAPAMAYSGVTEVESDSSSSSSPIQLGLAIVEKTEGTFGGVNLIPYPNDKVFVKHEMISFIAQIKVPKNLEVAQNDYADAELVIETNNITLSSGKADLYVTDQVKTTVDIETTSDDSKVVGVTIAKNEKAVTMTYVFTGYINKTENGTIKATLMSGQTKTGSMKPNHPYYVYGSKKLADGTDEILYTLTKGDDYYQVLDNDADCALKFMVKDNQPKEIIVIKNVSKEENDPDKPRAEFTVIEKNGSLAGFRDKKYNIIDSDSSGIDAGNYMDCNRAFTKIMNYMGFKLDAGGELFDKLFTNKLKGIKLTASVNVPVYGAPTTTSTPGTSTTPTEIPKTGDNATTMGFVMIAAAIIAAAAVAYRKVRN